MKIVYSDRKSGKTSQAEVPKEFEGMVIGKKIGEQIEGSVIKLDGIKMQITGLTDNTGASSRREIDGTRKAWPLLSSPPGIRKAKHGYRARRLIRGNTVSADTAQVNTVIVEMGSYTAEQLFKPKEKKAE
ncbi:MAG: S6e family ribosomal protein [Candidatus Micrarchaeaceae archaeon]